MGEYDVCECLLFFYHDLEHLGFECQLECHVRSSHYHYYCNYHLGWRNTNEMENVMFVVYTKYTMVRCCSRRNQKSMSCQNDVCAIIAIAYNFKCTKQVIKLLPHGFHKKIFSYWSLLTLLLWELWSLMCMIFENPLYFYQYFQFSNH